MTNLYRPLQLKIENGHFCGDKSRGATTTLFVEATGEILIEVMGRVSKTAAIQTYECVIFRHPSTTLANVVSAFRLLATPPYLTVTAEGWINNGYVAVMKFMNVAQAQAALAAAGFKPTPTGWTLSNES